MSPRPTWRAVSRHRAAVFVGLAFLAALAVILLGRSARTFTALDPDNPGPEGAQALARVLDDHGVDVTVARDAEALESTEVATDTTVVVTSTQYLGEQTTARLLEHTREASLVLVDPGPGLVDAIGTSEPPSQVTRDGGWEAECPDPRFSGLRVEVDRALAYPGDGCFPAGGGSLVATHGDVVSFGLAEVLTNDQILRADNAAAAVRLLGDRERLVWYIPTIDDLPAGDGVSLETLLPRWVGPGLVLVTIAALALVVWRARRLGPLATEPLPVVIKAIETTHARGRLYRKAQDRPHAADALRRATRVRLARRLNLPGPSDPALVREVARHSGRPEPEVAALLDRGVAPGNDRDLIMLARGLADLDRLADPDRLADLDREVRRT